MGRHVDRFLMGYAGVCNVCGGYCSDMHRAYGECYWCHAGDFIHRNFWNQRDCGCERDRECKICGGFGFVATPREDLTEAEVESINAEEAERAGRRRMS